jgi:hypothetical protein
MIYILLYLFVSCIVSLFTGNFIHTGMNDE